MAGKAGLKAGLIGVVILGLISVAVQLWRPSGALTYLICGVDSLIYIGIGGLAAFFLAPPRTPGRGAGAGSIAGLIAGGVSSALGSLIMALRWSQGLPVAGLDAQQMQMLAESGMEVNPIVFAIPGAICGLVMGLVLASIGGAILAAVKPD